MDTSFCTLSTSQRHDFTSSQAFLRANTSVQSGIAVEANRSSNATTADREWVAQMRQRAAGGGDGASKQGPGKMPWDVKRKNKKSVSLPYGLGILQSSKACGGGQEAVDGVPHREWLVECLVCAVLSEGFLLDGLHCHVFDAYAAFQAVKGGGVRGGHRRQVRAGMAPGAAARGAATGRRGCRGRRGRWEARRA